MYSRPMNLLQIFYDWFWVMPAFFIGLFALLSVYTFFEPWIKGKTREELKQIQHENFIQYQKREQEKKEQALNKTLLNLSDKDFEKFFSEVCSVSEDVCIKHTNLSLIDTMSVYGEVRSIREAKKSK